MTLKNKLCLLLCIFFLIFTVHAADETSLPAVERVMQKDFPENGNELEKTTNSLWREYQEKKNITSLIFYSYGMLKLADRYSALNDLVHAAEYAKVGFFYLDEAVDLHENDTRVRYLRARVDAWLPGELGRCVIALNDTGKLLVSAAKQRNSITNTIYQMRYRAFKNCNQDKQAELLLTQIKHSNPDVDVLTLNSNAPPAWSVSELENIILPLVRNAND